MATVTTRLAINERQADPVITLDELLRPLATAFPAIRCALLAELRILNLEQARRESSNQPTAAGASPRRALRALRGLLAAYSAGIGAYAVVTPHAFYRKIIGVDLLGPYNEHLISDVGGLYLGFALLFTWGARTLRRELARSASIAFTLTQAIHLGYHVAHLKPFTLGQAVEELAGLLPLLLLPIAALILTRRTTG